MPGIPVPACETSYSRSTDQTSRQDACVHLSAEEELAAEESLSIYCKPVELYNILRRRAIRNPSFLQRCLDYRIKAKHKKRITMTVSLSWSVDETQTVFPLYICLARQDPNDGDAEYSAFYRISRIFIFRHSSGVDGNTEVQANFMLPEVNKLAVEARSGTLYILFFTTVDNPNSSSEVNASPVPLDRTSNESRAGEYCLCGNVSLESLYMAWDSSPNFILGQRAEMMSTVDLLPCFLKYQDKDQSISIQAPCNSENVSTSKKLQITVSAEEFGAEEKYPYHTYSSSDVSSPSLSRIIRLREGNVMFNYRYYNNKLQRTEVTEEFSCPFCLVRCGSYKGLRYHLLSSHDLFNFEFSALEDQAVNVSVKTDILNSEIVADDADPKLQTFIFCAKPLKCSRLKNLSSKNAKDADPPDLESVIPAGDGDTEPLEKADDGVSNAIIQSHPDPDCVPSISEHDHGTPAVQQVAKKGKLPVEHSEISEHDHRSLAKKGKLPIEHSETSEHDNGTPAVQQVAKKGKLPVEHSETSEHDHRSLAKKGKLPVEHSDTSEHDHGTPAVQQVAKKGKLPAEHSDPRSTALLKRRQFYHSHKYQPMSLEEVLSDHDSENEVDDEIADIEDRRMLDNFVDVTKDEKRMMHMWNSFVRRQRVLADGHIPWACKAFSKLHAPELAQSPGLAWCWRLFMIKLWNHSLLDARTINTCSLILEEYQKQNSDPQS